MGDGKKKRQKSSDEDRVLRAVRREFLAVAKQANAGDHLADLMSDEDVAAQDPLEFVVDGWCPEDSYTALYGPPGVGKTFVLLGMTRAVRRGIPWQDCKTLPGAALYYQGEGVGQFRDRIKAWDAFHPLGKKDEMQAGAFLERTVDLTKPEGVAAIVRTVRAYERRHEIGVRLLVIEPLVEYMTGDENREGMERASRGLRALARLLTGCAVIVGHHSNASGERERGAAFLRMRAGAFIRMEHLDKPKGIVGLLQEKQRNGVELAMTLEAKSVENSLVHELAIDTYAADYIAERESTDRKRKAEARENRDAKAQGEREDKIISALRKFHKAGKKRVSQSKLEAEVKGNHAALVRALEALRDRGVLSIDDQGRGKPKLIELTKDWLASYTGDAA